MICFGEKIGGEVAERFVPELSKVIAGQFQLALQGAGGETRSVAATFASLRLSSGAVLMIFMTVSGQSPVALRSSRIW